MRTQTMVQLNRSLLSSLDARAARDGVSRSQLIRDAVEAYLAADAEVTALQRVVEGYRRTPETDEEMLAARQDARALVAEEPW
jgi:metal-responsive CopG/Arc/MetJ family transcriptional regulator